MPCVGSTSLGSSGHSRILCLERYVTRSRSVWKCMLSAPLRQKSLSPLHIMLFDSYDATTKTLYFLMMSTLNVF